MRRSPHNKIVLLFVSERNLHVQLVFQQQQQQQQRQHVIYIYFLPCTSHVRLFAQP